MIIPSDIGILDSDQFKAMLPADLLLPFILIPPRTTRIRPPHPWLSLWLHALCHLELAPLELCCECELMIGPNQFFQSLNVPLPAPQTKFTRTRLGVFQDFLQWNGHQASWSWSSIVAPATGCSSKYLTPFAFRSWSHCSKFNFLLLSPTRRKTSSA